MGKNIKMEDGPLRKRGRPVGKNRTPLSEEERRARNAHYERERRIETANAMADLAEAAGCDTNIKNADLIEIVVNLIKKASEISPTDNIDSLKKCNGNLMQQIQSLEQRLGIETDEDDESTCINSAGIGRKKIKLELSPSHSGSSYSPHSRGKQIKRQKIKTQDASLTIPIETWPKREEVSPVPDFEVLQNSAGIGRKKIKLELSPSHSGSSNSPHSRGKQIKREKIKTQEESLTMPTETWPESKEVSPVSDFEVLQNSAGIGRKKIKLELSPSHSGSSNSPHSRGKQIKREKMKAQDESLTMPTETWPKREEVSPVPDSEVPEPYVPFYATGTMDFAGAVPSDTDDAEMYGALQATWPEAPVQEADDGVLDLDYMQQWSVENFILEYL